MAVRTIALLAVLLVAGGECANQVVSTALSPDGRLQAVVFVRACGDPARFSTQVSLIKGSRPADKLGNFAGNLFLCEGRYGLSDRPEAPRVTATWTGPDALLVRHPQDAPVLAAKARLKGVEIRYEALPLPD